MADFTTADQFVDATLKALRSGTVVTYPLGPVIRTYQAGNIVGEIRSWIERPDGVYWELKEGGFTKHEKGKFDTTMAQNTASVNNYPSNSTNQTSGGSFTDSLLSLFDSFGKLLILLILVFGAAFLYKNRK